MLVACVEGLRPIQFSEIEGLFFDSDMRTINIIGSCESWKEKNEG